MNKITNKILNRYLPLGLAVLALVIGAVIYMVGSPSVPSAEAGWYSTGGTWGYRKLITIDHNKVSGTSTLANFPMLFSVTDTDLKYTGSGGKVGNTDGTDILFTSSDGTTKLDHEIEKYASTTGETIMWVRIPTLATSTDTSLYIYYGNAGASNQSNATGVWDSNYKGVYHLADGSTLNTNDSTSNTFNLTQQNTPTATTTGQIDGAMGLNGTNQYTSRTNVTHNSGAITVSLWANRDWTNTPAVYRDVFAISSVCDSGSGIGMSLSAAASGGDWQPKDILFYGSGYSGSSNPRAIAASGLTGSGKHLITGVLSATTAKIYVDGVAVSMRVSVPASVPTKVASLNVGGYVACNGYTDGSIDEVRYSDVARSAGWIQTEYNNQSSPSTFYAISATGIQNRPANTSGVKVSSQSGGLSWYSTGGTWGYRKQITIDHNKVSGTSTLANFPMLFSVTDTDLKYTGSGGKVGNSDGTDILFTSSDGTTKLDHEIEKYASTTGETIMWVRIPTLATSTDTSLYIYYGNAGASNQSNATGVWDSNYKAVWHYKDSNNLILTDSTSLANNGTNGGATAATGKIAGSSSYNGSTYATYGNDTSLRITGALTVSGWFRFGTYATIRSIFSKGYNGSVTAYALNIGTNGSGWPTNKLTFISYDGTIHGAYGNTTFSSANQGIWYYATGVWTGSAWKVYLNGTEETNVLNGGTGPLNSTTALAATGAEYQNGVYGQKITGDLDEVRVSNTARTSDWISTEYNNQNSPSTFFNYGPANSLTRTNSSGVIMPAIKNRGGVKFR